MKIMHENFARWVWTELLAFDNAQPDRGAAEYLESLGFVPDAMCLLLSSPDFILKHDGLDVERTMPANVCARDGQSGNERRSRQNWTNRQIRELVSALTRSGCKVYCSVFTTFMENKFAHEWLSDHPEVRLSWVSHWRGQELNVLAQLADGSLFEDYFIPQTVKVCRDYGFAGWHGPDGWGPWSSGSLCDTDFSDSMIGQFTAGRNWSLPECFAPIPRLVTMHEIRAAEKAGKQVPDWGLSQLRARRDWITRNHFAEWLDFIANRWIHFWRKMLNALHDEGFNGVINSAWTKANFDAYFEYGIHYRKMAEIGMDTMVVETVALGMSMMHPEEEWYHDDYASSLAEIKAACPNLQLIALHGIKDVCEFWDNLRHAPPAYERELYKLANMYRRRADGRLERSARGLLACLADGIADYEWRFIRERWKASFDGNPTSAGAVASVWSDAMLDAGVADYLSDAFMPGHDQTVALMQCGLDIQTFVRFEDAVKEPGALLVTAAHLLQETELKHLIGSHEMPVVLCGRAEFVEQFAGSFISDGRMGITVANVREPVRKILPAAAPIAEWPDFKAYNFSCRRTRQPVVPELWECAVPMIMKAVNKALERAGTIHVRTLQANGKVSLLTKRITPECLEVGIENRMDWGRPQVTLRLSEPIREVEILSAFPSRVQDRPDEWSVTVPVAPRGVTVLRLRT